MNNRIKKYETKTDRYSPRNNTPENANDTWDGRDLRKLVDLYLGTDMTIKQLASVFGRSDKSIEDTLDNIATDYTGGHGEAKRTSYIKKIRKFRSKLLKERTTFVPRMWPYYKKCTEHKLTVEQMSVIFNMEEDRLAEYELGCRGHTIDPLLTCYVYQNTKDPTIKKLLERQHR